MTAMTRDSVTLTWTPPRNDGGGAVTGYTVESRSSSYYAWTSSSVGQRVGEPHFVVRGLVDGTSYEFRVVAENRSGRSEPSPASPPVVVRDVVGTRHSFLRTSINCSIKAKFHYTDPTRTGHAQSPRTLSSTS